MNKSQANQSSWLASQLRQGLNADQFRRGIKDLVDGWTRRRLWITLGLHDIRQRYRRSAIGPFWITISMGVMVGALGLLYGQIFKLKLEDYLPYLACGFVIWGLISGLILDGTRAFTSADYIMRQLAAPISTFVYRTVWSNLIIFGHNIWIFLIVALIYGTNPGWHILEIVPAMFLILLNGVWMGLLLGLLSARFRDVPLIVASVIQVAFFITPVIWKPDMLPGRALLLDLNPLYHLVEILRGPLLGYSPHWENWLGVLIITVVGWAVTLYAYTAYRWRIVYWV